MNVESRAKMCKKRLDECRNGKEFLNYSLSKKHQSVPVEIRWGKGDHVIIETPLGSETIPVSHELGKGLRQVVIKGLLAIGITATIWFLFFILPNIGVV
jgi:hypothetical protein